MSMSKRFQIPVSREDEKLIQSAAKIYKISAAEWARRVLRKAAERDLSCDMVMSPLEALQVISKLDAPVADVQTMINQSVKGRLR